MGIFVLDQDLHHHSKLSACSRDELQTPAAILKTAKRLGITSLCLTDHYWDRAVEGASDWYAPQDFEHISASKPLVSADGIRYLFGCETDLDQHMRLGLPPSRYGEFDFIVIPTTHLHMTGFTISQEDAKSLAARARLWVERFDAVLSMDLPFHKVGIAHLACGLLAGSSRADYLTALNMIPTSEMERLFAKAASLGVGIELNQFDVNFADDEADTVLRMFRIAKEKGCRFYTASDAHHPEHYASYCETMNRVIRLLELDESDKFCI